MLAFRVSGCGRRWSLCSHLSFARVLLIGAALSLPVGGEAIAQDLSGQFPFRTSATGATVDHAAWGRLLSAYVVPGADGISRVAYAKFKAERHAELKRYIASLEQVDVRKLGRSEQFAFWANLYNAKTVDIVLDNYPVASIRNINLGGGLLTLVTGGPWKAKVVKVTGVELSLDDIEHAIMRPVFKDARVHYAVNCASIGCPNLMREPFSGARLEAQLDAAARAYVNHPRGFDVKDGKVTASSIYQWYKEDFGGGAQGVLAHARRHAEQVLNTKLESSTDIANYHYDWSLNDAKR